MLEAPAQLAVVTMFLCIASADATRHNLFKRRNLVAVAGLVGGVGLATKETFGLVVLVALVCLVVSGWVVTRREALRVLLISLVVYTVSVAVDASSFGFKIWWNAKLIGMLRLIGSHQNSGFNAPQTHVSFLSRVVADGIEFWGHLPAVGGWVPSAPSDWCGGSSRGTAKRLVQDRVGGHR